MRNDRGGVRLLWIRRIHGVRRDVLGGCRRREGRDELEPVAAQQQAHVERHLLRTVGEANGHLLDPRFERHGIIERLGRRVTGCVLLQPRRLHPDLRDDWRPRIVAAELADLPLARQHPQRIANLRPEGPLERFGARPSFEPVPQGDGWCRALGQHRLQIRRDESVRHLTLPRARPGCSARGWRRWSAGVPGSP